jgi:hypothetical protein
MTKQILKDGERFRVPLQMMDAMQKDIREHYAADAQPAHLVDAFGSADGLSRPGPRYLTAGSKTKDHAVLVTRETEHRQARDAAVQEMADAWKTSGSDREVARVHTDGDERTRAWMDQVADLTTSWSRQR